MRRATIHPEGLQLVRPSLRRVTSAARLVRFRHLPTTTRTSYGAGESVLRRNGKLCLLGIPDRDLSLSAVPLVFFQRSLVSSGIGSRLEMRQMLHFSARNGIRPQVGL
jgi:hypothetical protein